MGKWIICKPVPNRDGHRLPSRNQTACRVGAEVEPGFAENKRVHPVDDDSAGANC